MTEVDLTNDELLLLDGRVSAKVQKEIDRIKIAMQHVELGLPLALLIADGLQAGRILWNYDELKGIQSCAVCHKRAGYAQYQSGRYRGEENYGRPLRLMGHMFTAGNQTIRLCAECATPTIPRLQAYILEHDLPIEIPTDTRYIREAERKCFACEKTSWLFDMGTEPTVFDQGYYYGRCPHCGAVELPLSPRQFEATGNFRLVRPQELTRKSNLWVRLKKEAQP